jgi:ABC-type nitrate/sulfonate/bicarbonate transport system permease component
MPEPPEPSANDASPTKQSSSATAPPDHNVDQPGAGTVETAGHIQRLKLFGLRSEIPRWLMITAGCLSVTLCALLWWWTTLGSGEERILGHNQLPSVAETWERLPEVLDSKSPERHIWDNTFVSLKRVIIGFALALLVGIPIGVAAGCFPLVGSFFAPLVLFGRNIPIAALIPLVLALFGTDEKQKYMFIVIACVAFIIADTIDAVSEVAQRYVETALTLGASRLQIVFKVLVPLAMPMVFNSLRVLFGLAFGYIMLVEFMHEGEGAGGLGFLLNIARRRSTTEYTMIIILTIPVVAYVIDQLLYIAQCWLFRWKYGKEAERSTAFRLSRRVLRLFWRREPAPVAASAD